MKYLTIEDLRGLLRINISDEITEDDRTIYNTVEEQTLDLVTSYIGSLYNLPLEYARTLDERNNFLVRIVLDIFAYDLYTRATVMEMSDIRQVRYDKAINTLMAIAAGDINPDLPKRDVDNDPEAIKTNVFGSNTKNNTQW